MTGTFQGFSNASQIASEADYFVYQLGASIYASALTSGLSTKSGSSSDAGAVIQAAINALKARALGGKIVFKGSLPVNTPFIIYPGMGFVGQGPLSAAPYGTSQLVVTANVTTPVITATLDTANPNFSFFPWFANFAIVGTHAQSGQDAILIDNSNGQISDAFLDHVLVFDVGGNGLNVDITGSFQTKCWVNNCYFEHCQGNGIRNRAYALRVSNSYIYGCVLLGIDEASCTYMQILGSELHLNVGGAFGTTGINLGGEVLGNTFFNNGSAALTWAAHIGVNASAQRFIVSDNLWRDDRAGSAVANFLMCGDLGAVVVTIHGNTFSGMTGKAILRKFNSAGDNYSIRNNQGFNDTFGVITNPVNTTRNTISTVGTTGTVVASTDYVIQDCDLYINSSGGTGIAIVIKDSAGNTVASPGATFSGIIPIGYKINFGAFSGAPTLVASVI